MCLPEIERRACELFLQFPFTAGMPSDPTPPEHLATAQRAGHLWVGRVAGGAPVGFALVDLLGEEFHLEELDVLPAHGGQGLGTALVRTVCTWAAGQGASVTLCTFRAIPWNAPFYERLGFVPLRPEQLTPALEGRMREAERGLAREHRVAMRWSQA